MGGGVGAIMDGASYSLMVYIIMSIIILPSNPTFSCCNSPIKVIIVMLPYVLHSYVRVFHCHTSIIRSICMPWWHLITHISSRPHTLSLANCQDATALSLALKHVG